MTIKGDRTDPERVWPVGPDRQVREAHLWLTPVFVVEYVLSRMDRQKARKVLDFMTAWAATERALGHPPTLEEYSVYWSQGIASSYREQRLFRECFPGQRTPSRVNTITRLTPGLDAMRFEDFVTAWTEVFGEPPKFAGDDDEDLAEVEDDFWRYHL